MTGLVILGQRVQVDWLQWEREDDWTGYTVILDRKLKEKKRKWQKRNGLTGSGSRHDGDDDGQTEAGEMRGYRGCSPQPHI